MKIILLVLGSLILFGIGLFTIDFYKTDMSPNTYNMKTPLNYASAIPLDAESLAETGMAEKYNEIQAAFNKLNISLTPIEEIIDNKIGSYEIRHGEKSYIIIKM